MVGAKIGWKLVQAAFTIVVGLAASKAVSTAWKLGSGGKPPKNGQGGYAEVAVWAAVSAGGRSRREALRGAPRGRVLAQVHRLRAARLRGGRRRRQPAEEHQQERRLKDKNIENRLATLGGLGCGATVGPFSGV